MNLYNLPMFIINIFMTKTYVTYALCFILVSYICNIHMYYSWPSSIMCLTNNHHGVKLGHLEL